MRASKLLPACSVGEERASQVSYAALHAFAWLMSRRKTCNCNPATKR